MAIPSGAELSGLAVLGTLGSVCAVLLRSTHKNLDSLSQMQDGASAVIEQLRAELRDNDDTISKLQALCANYRYNIGALRAERRQLKLEIDRLRAADPMTKNLNQTKEGQ
jgi:hypothetical protein